MAIIMRSNGQKRDQGDNKKQIYLGWLWISCCININQRCPEYGQRTEGPRL